MMFKRNFGKKIAMTVLAASLAISGSAMVMAQDNVAPDAPTTQQERPQRDSAVRDYLESLGITREIAREAFENGSTLADVIVANGGSVDEFTSLANADLADRIQNGIDEGRITQEEADEILANAGTKIDERLNGERPLDGERPERPQRNGNGERPESDGERPQRQGRGQGGGNDAPAQPPADNS